MHSRMARARAVADELRALALDGGLDAACLLGVIEAPHAPPASLDANPSAARVYAAARAVERQRLEVEWDELLDQVAAALL